MPPKIDLTADSPALGSPVKPAAPQVGLKDVSNAAIMLLTALDRVARAEEELRLAKEMARVLSEKVLPDAMAQVGLEKFTLLGGGEVVVEQVIEGSIPADRAEEAFLWLREHEHGDLIKRVVSVPFGRGEDSRASKLVQLIEKSRMSYSDKSSVHHQTLKSWAKEMLSQGKPFPADLLGLYIARRAKIKA